MEKTKKIVLALVSIGFLVVAVLVLNQLANQKMGQNQPIVSQNQDSKDAVPGALFSDYIKNNPDLEKIFEGKSLDEEFCFTKEEEGEEGIMVNCFVPSEVVDETKEFKEILEVVKTMQRDDSFASMSAEKEAVKQELPADFIDQSVYPENTMAAAIQQDQAIQTKFQGKMLTDEFCFSNPALKDAFTCIVPAKTNNVEQDFNPLLEAVTKMERMDDIVSVPQAEQPAYFQLYASVLYAFDGGYKEARDSILAKIETGNAEMGTLVAGAFVNALEGDYAKSDALYAEACANYADAPCEKTKVVISGQVSDSFGKPITSAKVIALSHSGEVLTDSAGNYVLELETYPFGIVRTQAFKTGFSLGVKSYDLLEFGPREFTEENFVLNAPVKSVTLNNATGKVIQGEKASVDGTSFIVETDWSKYQIPFNSIVKANGESYQGEFDAFLFEFDKSTQLDDLLYNDTFDEVVGYAGDLMKTFGMPFVVFISAEGDALHVQSSNPMTLTYTMPEMEALRTNQDGIYVALDDGTLEALFNYSEANPGYPITRAYLIENQILQFPAWWVFDQKAGIWENAPFRLVDKTGKIETIFYTLNQ